MARRREVARPAEVDRAPLWVRQQLAGLTRFGGDLGAWRRARARWCQDNRCRRVGEPCTRVEALRCAASVDGLGGDTVRVVRRGPA